MENIRMVDLVSQYENMKEEIDAAMQRVVSESRFINGPDVKDFSGNLSSYLGAKHVIPCANGTDALQLALMALDLPAGSEVLVPSFNYVAAAEMLPICGLEPVFFDSRPDTFNLDEDKIEDAISEKTRAIIVVHLFGQACDMDRIMSIASKRDLKVIEDNAQSIGSTTNLSGGDQKFLGTIGDIGTTSFFPSKNLGCYGDGGAVYTQDDALAEKVRMFANHGQVKKYEYDLIGINSRLDTLQASILNVKIKRLNGYIEARRGVAAYYDDQLKDLDWLETPYRNDFSKHVFHQYTLRIKGVERDALKAYLESKGIPSMIYYPKPLHQNPAYSHYRTMDLKVADQLSNEVLSIPMHTELEESTLDFICETIKDFK